LRLSPFGQRGFLDEERLLVFLLFREPFGDRGEVDEERLSDDFLQIGWFILWNS
jgi:hypothetical protein